jgi:polyhydroxyalkanoate synthesis regulator phasin
MADTAHLIASLLCDMRAEAVARREEMHAIFDALDKRLSSIEQEQVCLSEALVARSLARTRIAHELDRRIGMLERRVQTLESRR